MLGEQMALPLLTLVHSDDEPPEAFADWFARGVSPARCRSCRSVQTRGVYYEFDAAAAGVRSEPMCPRCWLSITRADLRLIGGAA